MDDFVLPTKLVSDIKMAADTIRGHQYIHIFSHYDSDGLTSAAICAKALFRAGKEFRVTIFETLSRVEMGIIRECNDECILVTDLGSSYIKEFDELGSDVVVLDHHPIGDLAERIVYANPHLYGINGTTEACGASMSLLFAVELDPNNWDLCQVALAGMAGDRQHIHGLLKINQYILRNAVEKGFVQVMNGTMIPSGKLGEALLYCTDPYIKGISGDPEGVKKFLEEAGISEFRSKEELTEEEARRLSSMIAVKLIQQGVSLEVMNELGRDTYLLRDWGMDADCLSGIINSAGRMKATGLGVATGMGDKSAMKQALEVKKQGDEAFINVVLSVVDGGLNQLDNIQWFDSSNGGYTGMVCGTIMNYMSDATKPTIGINLSGDVAHVSSRGVWGLIDKGLNLTYVMRNSCGALGMGGGGHVIASGGKFPSDRLNDFLRIADMIVGMQLGKIPKDEVVSTIEKDYGYTLVD